MIYPNPTTSKLNIDLNQTVANSKIEIRSVAGQLLYTNEAIKSNTIEVPVSEWANGMYFISFYTQDKKWVGKFMKE
jgi:endoglucanase